MLRVADYPCDDPETLSNATVQVLFSHDNVTAVYACDDGYRFSPNEYNTAREIVCRDDGTWSDIDFSCECTH